MKLNLSIIFALLMSVCISYANAAPKKSANKRVDKIASIFSGKKTARLEVEKSVTSELLQKTTTSQGEIFLGQGKLRWEVKTPEKALILFDGKFLWTEQFVTGEADETPQVTKSKIAKSQKDQDLIKLLTGEKWSNYLTIAEESKEGENDIIKMSPKSTSSDIKEFSFVVNGKGVLTELRYVDEVGNATSLKILKSETVKKPKKGLFTYKVPASAQVNEI